MVINASGPAYQLQLFSINKSFLLRLCLVQEHVYPRSKNARDQRFFISIWDRCADPGKLEFGWVRHV